MPKGTGLELFRDTFPNRFFDVGIAESHAVGLASGLAKEGLIPVVAIYSTFLQRAFDQIIHDVALQKLGVVFALDRAGVVGVDGPTHHGTFDVGYLRLIPNMICMAPKDRDEFSDMLSFAVELNQPVSIRYPKDEVYSLPDITPIELGKAQIINQGKDICLISLGSMLKISYECLALLKDKGIDVSLVNARFIKPLDKELLLKLVKEHKVIITLEEGSLSCGFGSAIAEVYEAEGYLDKVKLIRVGFPDEFIPSAKREELFSMYEMDSASLAKRVESLL